MLRIYIIKHIMMTLNKKTQSFCHHDFKQYRVRKLFM